MHLRNKLIATLVLAFGFVVFSDAFAQIDPNKDRGDRGGDKRDTTKVDPPKRDTVKKDPPKRDTVKKDPQDRDTVKKDPPRGDDRKRDDQGRVDRGAAHLVSFYLRNDSCRRVFMSHLSAEEAEQLANLLAALERINAQIKDLRQQLREARAAGDREAYARISAALREAFQLQARAHHAVNDFMRAHAELALRIMKDCGGRPGNPQRDGKRGDGNTDIRPEWAAMIVPNPVTPESAAKTQVILKLSLESKATISVSDAAGVVLKTIEGTFSAGANNIPLDLTGIAPGIYYVRIQVGDQVQTLKLMIR